MQASNLIFKCEKVPFFQCIRRHFNSQFVPKHRPANPEDVQKLENFLRDRQSVLVLTGAGISTESGEFELTNDAISYQIIHNKNK